MLAAFVSPPEMPVSNCKGGFSVTLNAQEIQKMRSVNLGAVDKETLVDASGFVFDNSLPMEKRAARMLEQLKNPYCFRYGDMAIKLEFAEDGLSLQELLTAFFLRQKSGL